MSSKRKSLTSPNSLSKSKLADCLLAEEEEAEAEAPPELPAAPLPALLALAGGTGKGGGSSMTGAPPLGPGTALAAVLTLAGAPALSFGLAATLALAPSPPPTTAVAAKLAAPPAPAPALGSAAPCTTATSSKADKSMSSNSLKGLEGAAACWARGALFACPPPPACWGWEAWCLLGFTFWLFV